MNKVREVVNGVLGTKFDGVLKKRTFMEGSTLVSETTQPTQRAILNDNAEIRKNPHALRKMGEMEWALQIPTLDYERLIKCNPDLTHQDAQLRTAAWKKFIAGPESIPYRVRHQRGKTFQ